LKSKIEIADTDQLHVILGTVSSANCYYCDGYFTWNEWFKQRKMPIQ